VRQRLVVLISGSGTNLQSLLESLPNTEIPADVVAVGSDTMAPGLQHATDRSIPTFVVLLGDFSSREEWGVALGDALDSYQPDLIVLSGFMKLLPPSLVSRFAPRIINTHPAFLPEFPGAHAVRDAMEAGVSHTGASVIVVDEGVDTGEILAQRRVPVEVGDDEASLHDRIKVVERELLLEVLETLCAKEGT
jgi:phosphoribosylglycinamide formyltransferase-1